MRHSDYEEMFMTQSVHWWFEGKRRVIDSIIRKKIIPPKNSRVLEIGSGTGANLAVLSQYGNVTAMELDDYAREAIRGNSCASKVKGWLPDGLTEINGQTFDLICMFDVLEHVENDGAALESIKPFLNPEGKIIITVPAYQWLFSVHDKNLGHYRRYTRRGLSALLSEHGFNVTYSGYMNTFLFPLMMIARLFNTTGTGIPGFGLNKIFTSIYSAESIFIPAVSFPFGGTVTAVCKL